MDNSEYSGSRGGVYPSAIVGVTFVIYYLVDLLHVVCVVSRLGLVIA